MKMNYNSWVILMLDVIIIMLIFNNIGLNKKVDDLTKKLEMRLQIFPVSGGTELNNMPEEIQDANLVH